MYNASRRNVPCLIRHDSFLEKPVYQLHPKIAFRPKNHTHTAAGKLSYTRKIIAITPAPSTKTIAPSSIFTSPPLSLSLSLSVSLSLSLSLQRAYPRNLDHLHLSSRSLSRKKGGAERIVSIGIENRDQSRDCGTPEKQIPPLIVSIISVQCGTRVRLPFGYIIVPGACRLSWPASQLR